MRMQRYYCTLVQQHTASSISRFLQGQSALASLPQLRVNRNSHAAPARGKPFLGHRSGIHNCVGQHRGSRFTSWHFQGSALSL